MSTLYRKYRPQNFSEVAGQAHIKQVLQNEIKTNKIAHAFLFSGPRGIGKTTIARILAKSVNCESRKDGEFEPCNSCDACQEITNSKSLDVVEMDAATHTQVDKVRENIIENINFAPARKKYKVFIIDEVHMLSISAFNALLKTLEEPPAHAIFVLATTEIHKIPETIISRCQKFDFQKISFDDLLTRLKMLAKKEGVEIEDDVILTIARNAEGGLRDAEGLLGQVLSIFDGKSKITAENASVVLPKNNFSLVRDFVLLISDKKTAEALKFVSSLSDNGVDTKRFMDQVIEYLRGILSFKYLGDDSVGAIVSAENDKEILEKLSPERTVLLIEVLLKRKETANFSKIDELPLELAVIEMCGEGGVSRPDSVIASGVPQDEAPQSRSNPVIASGVPQDEARQSRPSVATPPEKIEKPAPVLSEKPTTEVPPVKEDKSKENVGAENLQPKETKKPLKPASFSLDEVRKKWYVILEKASDYSPSLPVVLNMGVPLKIEEGVLKIGFQYSLYKEKFNKVENLNTIQEIFGEILGGGVNLEGIILENGELEEAKKLLPPQPVTKPSAEEPPKEEAPAMSVDKIAEAFGGKVVS